MKKLYNSLLILTLPSVLILFSYSTGSPGGKTGSMGDGGSTCTDCHVGTAQSQADWILTDIPLEGFYAGETYTITATGTHSGVVKFGFELTAEDETGAKTGTFTITEDARTKLVNSNSSVTHIAGGTTPTGETISWSMEWTAPDPAPENVNFNAAFNAANGNGTTGGDVIYKTETSVNQAYVGIGDPQLTNITSIYPNPAYDNLSVLAPVGSNIQIMDISGKVITSRKAQNDLTSMDVSSYQNGLYIIKLEHNGDVTTHKLIVR